MGVTQLNPLEIIAQKPRCPKCSSHKATRLDSGWGNDAKYGCEACGEKYEVRW